MAKQIQNVIQMFIDEGREIDAFAESARWGELKTLKYLLVRGIPIDAKAKNGATALMHAASGGQVKIVKYLLEHGANANASADVNGCTPLISCLAALHKEARYMTIIQMLLDAGADPTLRDSEGRDALSYAGERNSEKVVDLLKSKLPRTEA